MKWTTPLAVILLAVSACSSDGIDEEAEMAFLEGRETIEVYRLMPPEGFDAEATLLEWADVLGIEDDFFPTRSEISRGLSDEFDDGSGRGVGINLQTGTFSGGFEGRGDEGACRECTDATIDPTDALQQAQDLFASLGFDIEDVDWTTKEFPPVAGEDYATVVVEGQRTLDGRPFGRPFFAEFANGDQILRYDGSINIPTSRGQVGLLTPQEALAQESRRLAVDVPIESIDDAQLAWSVSFDRFELTSFMVPVYQFPLNADLGLTNNILAIRHQDVPTE